MIIEQKILAATCGDNVFLSFLVDPRSFKHRQNDKVALSSPKVGTQGRSLLIPTRSACGEDAFFALTGCSQPNDANDRGCGSGPTISYFHLSVEGWTPGCRPDELMFGTSPIRGGTCKNVSYIFGGVIKKVTTSQVFFMFHEEVRHFVNLQIALTF